MSEQHFESGSKIVLPESGLKIPRKGRGRARKSIELINAMYDIAKATQPITGRGVGYKLFTMKLIAAMSTNDMNKVYRLLKEAREEGTIPWVWIVDESRELEKTATWDDPDDFIRTMNRAYRREFWNRQPVRVEVWSEKGTVRGVLRPLLDEYGIGFRNVHGFSGATAVHDVATDKDKRPLIIIYVGDRDPSGMCMTDTDLPKRFAEYGGHHVTIERVALLPAQCVDSNGVDLLPSFPASDKKDDPRYPWFVRTFGDKAWELDAMDPNDLRALVEEAIKKHIEWEQWERDVQINKAERESLRTVLAGWGKPATDWNDHDWNHARAK